MKVSKIMTKAVQLGACSESGKATDWKSLAWLFFSPQGREFCTRNNYPHLDDFQKMPDTIKQYGVFVDCPVEKTNEDIALIGPEHSVLTFNKTGRQYRVILMHGAHADIKVGNYAVIKVENISGSFEGIYNK